MDEPLKETWGRLEVRVWFRRDQTEGSGIQPKRTIDLK